jgi:formylglycine-generating enzyme required for sulfatase activity
VSSITQAKAEAQKLIKQYNKLQADAKQADAAEAARKTSEAEKLVSQISALQSAIAKLQAKDRETAAKKPAIAPKATTATTPTKVLTPEELKQTEAEKRALESRINRIEDAQRKTRAQIDQLTRAKAELARLREDAEKNVSTIAQERRLHEEKLQKELARLIEKKETEQQNLKQEMEAIRAQALKDAELLKVQRDAARAMMERQKKLESEKYQVRRRGGHKGLWIGIAIGGVMSIITLSVVILMTPLRNNISGKSANDKAATVEDNKEAKSSAAANKKETAPAEKEEMPKEVKPIKTFQDPLAGGGAGPFMIQLPEGSFMMGSKGSSPYQDERPQHKVSLQGFAIGKYEITFDEYDRFANSTGRESPKDNGWERGNHSVINVSYDDAVEYTKWLTEQTGHQYQLPTEREWEYAATAGTDTLFWWGQEVGQNKANCANCGSQWDGKQPAPIGSFAANAFGLHDTIGNVLEWTATCYHPSYQGSPASGQNWGGGNCQKRMVRSGSFQTYDKDLRTTKRYSYSPKMRMDTLGFRVVRSID